MIIWRNKVTNGILLGISSTNNQVKQIIISENIISYSYTDIANPYAIMGRNAQDCIINNNFCSGYNAIYSLNNSHICNNVFPTISTLSVCIVENNFFFNSSIYGTGDIGTCSNCSFNNNAFTGNFTFPFFSNNGSNNLMNQTTTNTFVVNDLSFPKNLKIKEGSPCKNAGTDGTDIGIYGGSTPYRSIPLNPHIDKAIIGSQTDKDGKLNVNIQVSAQTR